MDLSFFPPIYKLLHNYWILLLSPLHPTNEHHELDSWEYHIYQSLQQVFWSHLEFHEVPLKQMKQL
jgi:hypothetical protein